ncbi:MAG: paraquat-inducible protein A [Burkholderiaceae bacterium]
MTSASAAAGFPPPPAPSPATAPDPDSALARTAAWRRVSGHCACRECGLVHRIDGPLEQREYDCHRCGATLFSFDRRANDRALAYTVTALILLVLANAFPLVSIEMQGNGHTTSIFGAALTMWQTGNHSLAIIVFVTTVLLPTFDLTLLLIVLWTSRDGVSRPLTAPLLRVWLALQPWGMVGVFMLGTLVALVKLGGYANVMLGVSFWSLAGLLVFTTLISAAFAPDAVWLSVPIRGALPSGPRLDGRGAPPAGPMISCHTCGLTLPDPPGHPWEGHGCPRCRAALHHRREGSLGATTALLIAAMILYVPANVLPIMNTSSLLGTQSDTIISGVVFFWTSGSWPLALLVFFASVMVPMLKMLALGVLVWTTHRRSAWQPRERIKLYRLVEFVGRWSMLDIYVIAITSGLVQMGPLATITAGPAAFAFGLVVILTMLAAMQFDPRLIWDPLGEQDGPTA